MILVFYYIPRKLIQTNTSGKESTMKTLAFNGSPKAGGNTLHALKIFAAELEKEGIETDNRPRGQQGGPEMPRLRPVPREQE